MAFDADQPAALSQRIGVREREATIARLSEAYANDALPEAEFERRVSLVYQASLANDLAELTSDLPALAGDTSDRVAHDARSLLRPQSTITATFSNVERRGSGVVPTLLELNARFGSIELDLTNSEFGPGVTELRVSARFGSIEIALPDGVTLEIEGTPFFGSFASADLRPPEAQRRYAGAPIVRVTGRATFGSVEVNQYLSGPLPDV
jgi:hypothetical protein